MPIGCGTRLCLRVCRWSNRMALLPPCTGSTKTCRRIRCVIVRHCIRIGIDGASSPPTSETGSFGNGLQKIEAKQGARDVCQQHGLPRFGFGDAVFEVVGRLRAYGAHEARAWICCSSFTGKPRGTRSQGTTPHRRKRCCERRRETCSHGSA